MQATRFMVCLAAAMVGACDPEPSLDTPCHGETDALTSGLIEPGNPCPPDGCGGGGNSPVIDGVYFWQLHLLGQPTLPQGVKIDDVQRHDGVPMRLELDTGGDRLLGVSLEDDQVIAEGGELMGTKIRVSVKGKPYDIFIDRVGTFNDWFWAGVGLPVEIYSFSYSEILPEPRPEPLCSVHDDLNKIHAVVFGGETYDPITKRIIPGSTSDGWINIACADSAIYKMHRVGHTSVAETRGIGFQTSPEQRQAMFNAWTAKVCDNSGQAFTVQGEAITLQDSLGVFDQWPYNRKPESIEAIWDQHGAVCLNVPRRIEDDPGTCTNLAEACNLPPPCTAEQVDNWTEHGHVLTGNL